MRRHCNEMKRDRGTAISETFRDLLAAVIIMSLLRQNDAATSFWHCNDVIITSCVSWDTKFPFPFSKYPSLPFSITYYEIFWNLFQNSTSMLELWMPERFWFSANQYHWNCFSYSLFWRHQIHRSYTRWCKPKSPLTRPYHSPDINPVCMPHQYALK